MSKRENGQPRSTVNRHEKYPYTIEERGRVFLMKQNENTVAIPAEDLRKLIEKFTAMLERQEQKSTTSKQRHRKLYEPQSPGSREIKSKKVERSNSRDREIPKA